MVQKISRLQFMKTIAISGMAVTGAGLLNGCSSTSGNSNIKWDEETEIIIVGTGFAGCAAAVEAADAGAKIKVIEKMPHPGGNSILSGCSAAACMNPLQEKYGIKDSYELMVQDMLEAGLYINNVEKVRTVAENSWPAVKWTMDRLGSQWLDKLVQFGGHSVVRTYGIGGNMLGAGIIKPAVAELKKLNVKIETGRKLEKIILNPDGSRVLGITVRDKYVFGDEKSGKSINIKAQKAVILATGGFGADLTMRMQQDPRLNETFDTTNHKGATGEAMRAGFSAGVVSIQPDQIQLLPECSPDEKGFGVGPLWSLRTSPYNVIINVKTGKRIVNEMADRKRKADAIMMTGQPTINISDERGMSDLPPDAKERAIEAGILKQFNSMDEIAAAYSVPADALKAEIAKYNSFVANKKDLDFGKKIRDNAQPITGPYNVVRNWPKVHHCMGGLHTTNKGECIDQNNNIIKGLYAAGEIGGGTHGACRLGSCAVADCLVYGRVTAQEAVKLDAWK
jgi:flavocytochrome c